MDDKNKDQQLIDMLRMLPEREMPRDIAPAVMQAVAPKKVSLLRRLLLMARTPCAITVRPLRIAYAAAVFALIWTAVPYLSSQFTNQSIQTAIRKTDDELVPVTFTLSQQEAREIYLIGSFNNWQPEKHAMKFDKDRNMWVIKVDIPAGSHEYAFLIDNERAIADPQADFFKTDRFGSRNSIIFANPGNENYL